ncbi:hypothetical protein P168DRAFT_286408 [Aspergillus campestris IBT 28561]|uniref:Uncharacterized protein n=1 Tax=Aspergillus campestris (strain IBT 28561) TaxID=1392248 RepID=A0A2I1DEI0_ASPC2|nr:uncharacterized protein P168DRAFT_286408 [Aspergillus campestris IBT 28561]PKY08266.1 hypothetical protein P168DRAFT_286408 [Aspergillus campestris IBT 28561]
MRFALLLLVFFIFLYFLFIFLMLDFFFFLFCTVSCSYESLVFGFKSGVGASGVQSPLGHKSTSLLA